MHQSDIERFKSIPGLEVTENASLREYTGFRTGGTTTVLEPMDVHAFVECIHLMNENGYPYRVLGNGTNTIARDEGYDGFVLRLHKGFQTLRTEGCYIHAGAGVSLNAVCRQALDSSLSGMEFAYGIPGTVGGAVYMDAGAYGGEMKDVLESVVCYDCRNEEFFRGTVYDLKLGYRTSIFHEDRNFLLMEATFLLMPEDPERIREKMQDLIGRRRDKQPLEYPSCGSTFKRPEGAYAGALIEQCGLKGYQVGGAAVSEKHAGFVINRTGDATSADVFSVIDHVQQTVQKQTGYWLACEVEVLD